MREGDVYLSPLLFRPLNDNGVHVEVRVFDKPSLDREGAMCGALVLDVGTWGTLTLRAGLLDAARHLLELKDGPRDDAYREAREAAWARLREAAS